MTHQIETGSPKQIAYAQSIQAKLGARHLAVQSTLLRLAALLDADRAELVNMLVDDYRRITESSDSKIWIDRGSKGFPIGTYVSRLRSSPADAESFVERWGERSDLAAAILSELCGGHVEYLAGVYPTGADTPEHLARYAAKLSAMPL